MKKYYNKSKNNTVYYVVHKGHKTGIYSTWNECKVNVEKFEGAIYKKFTNEKVAIAFLQNGFGKFTYKKSNQKDKSKEINDSEEDDENNNDEDNNAINNDIINNNHIDNSIKNNNTNNSTNNKNSLTAKSLYIYTDGSCIKIKNIYVAGFGIHIPTKNISVSAPLLNQKITNNRAELTAIIDCIKYLDEDDLSNNINIVTDSQYSMYLFNGTGERYEKNGYKNEGKDVPNIDLIKKLLEIKRKYKIKLIKVRAHTGKKDVHSLNNEVADKLANDGALSSIEQNTKNSMCIFNTDKYIQNSCFNNNVGDSTDDNDSDNDNYSDDIKGNNYINNNNINNEKYNHINNNNSDTNNFNKNLYIKENIKKNIYIEEKINKDVQMNELFEFEELDDTQTDNKKKYKQKKNLKLSNWFIPKKI